MVVHIAIPAFNEANYISNTLSALIEQVVNVDFRVYVCVNQPESYWNDPEKELICLDNQTTLKLLHEFVGLNLVVLDYCSKGKGWEGKKTGVGIARKTLMDRISSVANKEDLVISLDADTFVKPHYVQSIVDSFHQFPNAVAMSVPYFHNLTGSEAEDRAILRYEIYMRNYAIQMLRINSPFAFTALGSAMAYRVKAYNAIGGLSPLKSGEDFYFLQQMRKFGTVIIANDELVFPAARFSNRVFFGTGPAMIKGHSGDWSSYPIYHISQFEAVKSLFDVAVQLMNPDWSIDSAFYQFLQAQFKDENFLNPIRKNMKDEKQFFRGFYTKVDGLRILQFLKATLPLMNMNDRELFFDNYQQFNLIDKKYSQDITLENFDISDLSAIRDSLFDIEKAYLRKIKILS